MNFSSAAIVSRAVRMRREFVELSDGTKFTRKLDPAGLPQSAWQAVEPAINEVTAGSASATTTNPRYLAVVGEDQAEGEPQHWSLFSYVPGPAESAPGQVWQVTGDAELMHYNHLEHEDRLRSDSYAWHHFLSRDLGDEPLRRIHQIARTQPPPQAPSRAAVRENCQEWTMRVVVQLLEEGVVHDATVLDRLAARMQREWTRPAAHPLKPRVGKP